MLMKTMKLSGIAGKIKNRLKVEVRERMNVVLAPYRRKKLYSLMGGGKIPYPFTIISNNCWGGHVYRFFGLEYNSPTIGLFFFADDYIKFLKDLRGYLAMELHFIGLEESRNKETLKRYGGECIRCPIALLGDIEIIFMHYKTQEEAEIKWKRRIKRMNWGNLIVKFSEQNGCTMHHLLQFDNLPCNKKLVFVTRDYGLNSQVIFKEFSNQKEIANDTNNFRKYINLYELITSR